MEMQTLDLGPQTAEVARIVAGVRDGQLGDPTPCAGTPVAGLLDHLVGLTLAFRMAAEKQPLAGGPRASAEHLVPDWRTVLPAQLEALAAAWREPAAWEGTAEVAGARLPAGAMGAIALNEVLVHGWDLAAATGQEYRPDPAAAQACLDLVAGMNQPGNQEMRDAQFGPVVPVPDDAPVLHRVLGLTGRNPRWTPSAAGERSVLHS
jgi:uncharacterized protein (TIGR03086 family)